MCPPRLIRTFTAFKRGHANSPFTPFKRRSNDVQTRIQGHFRPFGPKRLALARRLRRSNVVQTTQTNVWINLALSAEPEVLLHVPVIRSLVLLSIITIGVIVVVRLRVLRSLAT